MNPARRRGVLLAMVVMIMALVMTISGVLTLLTVGAHHRRRVDYVQAVARLAADSAAEFALQHASTWQQALPTEPVRLDISGLLPGRATGSAVLTCHASATGPTCLVEVRVRLGRATGRRVLAVHLADGSVDPQPLRRRSVQSVAGS